MTNTALTNHHDHTSNCWWDHQQGRWVCRTDSPSDAPTVPPTVERPLVDVRDMIVVHTAMLRELRLAPAAVTRTAPGDRKQARTVSGHLRLVCDMLHHHHEGEDELLWPKLLKRVPASAVATIEQAESQHEQIDATLTRAQQLRVTWAADPTAANRDLLVGQLETLHTLLSEHLDLEERLLLPLAASTLTPAEWKAIGEAGASSLPKSALMLVFGMFAYEGDPAVLANMLQSAPPPVRALVPRIAPRVYARRAHRIHGTERP